MGRIPAGLDFASHRWGARSANNRICKRRTISTRTRIRKEGCPSFQALPLSSVIERIKGQPSLPLGEFESSEARKLAQSCKDAGLNVVQLVNELPRYLLVNELTKRTLLIEDDDLASRVKDAALQRRIPIRHIEA